MRLKDIQTSYDVIFSLGGNCEPAWHMKRLNLRKYAGPLDWNLSPSLSDVNRLLSNRFQHFMELNNLFLPGGVDYVFDDGEYQTSNSLYVTDAYYNIITVHDFPNTADWMNMYPTIKGKYNYLATRFLDKIANSRSLLFVRWSNDSREEIVHLQSILSRMTKGRFHILVVQPSESMEGYVELDWGMKGVCALQAHQAPNIFVNVQLWDKIFSGMRLK
ncbi:DUF1796 family putative cysteine peptidase [Paenibacillus sp. NPDC056579]|uniref:DUF1796 family putative cysteine peptidase n=1 Tax=Paenibacillus sp. NPDC056579 TaxID=3345871 RepID=UPI0036C95282